MKTILFVCLILMFAATTVMAEHVIDESDNPRFLLVLSAESGSYDGETLTLTGVPSVVYFSDRPYRIAGHMSVVEFVEIWGEGTDSYEMDPPNAALSIPREDGNTDIIVELGNPLLIENGLTFNIIILAGDIHGSFDSSSLFIDYYDLGQAGHGSW